MPSNVSAVPTLEDTEPPRGKKIIVCCDGTGNSFAPRGAANSNSNVVKLYTALRLDTDQIGYYHPGVGTMGDPTKPTWLGRQMSRVFGLAFGAGFADNVLDAYRYLMEHYQAGDQVYLFGFSRGAYTVRALAGLLHGYGLLCRGNEGHLPYAWRMFLRRVKQQRKGNNRTVETDFSFRDTFSHKDFIIHFVGLWDTVSSVGWFWTPLRLLNLAQNASIVTGRHAVSIDERRCFYQDNLWGPAVPVQVPPVLRGTARGKELDRVQDIAQVWFAGVHSDVGGGYKQSESGLSNITLQWMIEQAEAAGAVRDPARFQAVMGEPVTNDPCRMTEDIAQLYEKPASAEVHTSLSWLWLLPEIFPHRFFSKVLKQERVRIPFGAWRTLPEGALLHPSVKRKLTAGGYSPKNLAYGTLLDTAANPSPSAVDLHGYSQFQRGPSRAGWKTNVALVFLLSTLEIGLGFYLLWHLVHWLVSLLCAIPRAAHWLAGMLPAWLQNTSLHAPWLQHTAWLRFWPFGLAVVILLLRSMVLGLRPKKHV